MTIADLISHQLKEDQQNIPQAENPQDSINQQSPHKHLRINLIHHRSAVNDLKTLQLFKSLVTTLWTVDPLLVILPYEALKQRYSVITNSKQIEALDDNKLFQYLQPYYQRQNYSLSGYIHIRTAHTYPELLRLPQLAKWLDSNRYFVKLCPSQVEEMVQIGALC